ncbi:MAG: aldo/keto reductase [Thermomicrobia bacterium]|nr:aldo/keto reductase [Thermomicrobia bacterium]
MSTLPHTMLGATGLRVTNLCLGAAPLGDMPETFAYDVPEERALATVRALLDSPINFIDTAASYGDGESERRIGIVLRERGGLPDGYVLDSKADRDLQTDDFSGDQMRRSVERSLRLLNLDTIPLMHLHDPEHTTFAAAMASGGPVEVLQRMKEEGLIASLGVAGGPIDMEIRYVETGIFDAVITHNRYTLLDQSANPLLTIAHERGLGVLNAAPYGSGMLAKGPDAYPRYQYQHASPAMIAQAKRLDAVCQRHGVSLRVAALHFSLRDPRIHSTIVGMTRPERVPQAVADALTPVPDALWEELTPLIAEYNVAHGVFADKRYTLPDGH